jgi:Gpi18-like mannosyltransferase
VAKTVKRKKPNSPPAKAADALQAELTPNQPNQGRLDVREIQAVAVILLVGFVLRAVLLQSKGHETDIGTFESWMLSTIKYGIPNFYGHAGFVDYPPGYIYVLAISGAFYHFISQFNLPGDWLRIAVKGPPVLADLGLAYLSFLIVRRTWSVRAGLWAMAIVVFNPAVWFVSAYWGQADSVTAVFLVWCVYLMLTSRYEFAWLVFAVAVLIKPQPLVAAPALLVWQLRSPATMWRLAAIPIIGLLVAYVGSVFFAPNHDPISVLSWLYDRYHTGTALYPYNSCNAFNLYSTRLDFWQPDSKLIPNLPDFPGWPQWAWGVTIVCAFVAAVVLREWRTLGPDYSQTERQQSFYTALFLSLLGLFMFATRMHERYLFSALAFGPLIWNINIVNRVIYVILSCTFVVNLFYALAYLYSPSADLAPWLVHPLSILNVFCLFVVAAAYLIPELGESLEQGTQHLKAFVIGGRRRLAPLAWEGLVGLTRLDYPIVTGLMIVTAVLLYTNIGRPAERIFDEIYYARSAQEYIHHLPQFEWTHPPLSKLLLTIGALIYHVDPVGCRLMSAFFGTLTVPLLYAFAKRLFASTPAAVVSVVLLLSSGYFYVQARIATPEIFVAFFALATLYCMYRLWIASQSVRFGSDVIFVDGSSIVQNEVVFEDGERLPLRGAKLQDDYSKTTWSADGARIEQDANTIQWRRDGQIEGTMFGAPVRDTQRWAFWLGMTSIAVACVISSKWNGFFDLAGIWGLALAVSLQRRLPWVPEKTKSTQPPRRFLWGNAYGFHLPLFLLVSVLVIAVVYLATYIPFFHIGDANAGVSGTSLSSWWDLQKAMYDYHHNLKATHPYSSEWWTWPLELRPVSYYYHVFSGTQPPNQIVAEVLALPNPIMWLAQIITVPAAAILAWHARHKGMLWCVAAYFFQWLPWIMSPRIDFQYNFYPNTAIICLCGAYVLMQVWRSVNNLATAKLVRGLVVGYLAACIVFFIFFLPVLNGAHITWNQWNARIWYKDGAPHHVGWI